MISSFEEIHSSLNPAPATLKPRMFPNLSNPLPHLLISFSVAVETSYQIRIIYYFDRLIYLIPTYYR